MSLPFRVECSQVIVCFDQFLYRIDESMHELFLFSLEPRPFSFGAFELVYYSASHSLDGIMRLERCWPGFIHNNVQLRQEVVSWPCELPEEPEARGCVFSARSMQQGLVDLALHLAAGTG